MTMSMPAPVGPGGRRGHVVLPAQKVRRGLIPMRMGSDHLIYVTPSPGAEPVPASCRARDAEDVGVQDPASWPAQKVRVICLHEKCAGKSWGSIGEMVKEHPAREAMELKSESHVYGLWCEAPTDPAGVEPTQKEIERLKTKLKGVDSDEKPDLHRRLTDKLTKAIGDLGGAMAVIGLIAPPDVAAG